MTTPGNENLHRRSDDCVSYKEMVEFVAHTETEWHSMRAESIIQMNNQMERIERSLNDGMRKLDQRMEKHETWHRDVLQGFLDRAVQNKLSTGALLASILSIIVSTALAVWAILSAHP